VDFLAALFGARRDVYALRWENARSGRTGWTPVVRGGWRTGVPAAEREYLPLSEEVLTAHLSGELELGLYPLLEGDRCCWLAADFDGPTGMLDALAYLKAARAAGAPAALEVSRSGLGAHAWLFFTAPVPAVTARQLGSGLLREAIAVRGRMDLASYERLFPSQDAVQAGGLGNLIAAPLQGRARRRGATVFLDLATLEPQRTSGPTCPARTASRHRNPSCTCTPRSSVTPATPIPPPPAASTRSSATSLQTTPVPDR
jgi:hypothetical protein